MRASTLVLWSGLFLAGCYSPDPPFGAPCSASQECPEGQECDLLTNICGFPTEMRALRDDTAAQFEGGALDGTIVEAGGFVGPVPYFVSGVRATGIAGNQLATSIDTTTFEQLAQLTPTGVGVLRGVTIDLGDGVPPLLGFTAADDITVLVEGEIFLDTAGAYQLEFRANDIGFLDIAAPGGAFERLASVGTTAEVLAYTVSTPGWHRFRGAFADSAMFLEWELRYRPPGAGGMRSVPHDIVRARVDGLDGAIVDGFDEAFVALHSLTGLVDKLDALQFTTVPYASGVGNGAYTLRWTAQFLIDTAGDYRFKLDTSQGHRLWIDGAQVANAYVGTAQATTTPMMSLEPGWHDLVIDALKTGGPSARFSFTVDSGPQFAGGGFPRDHLRPVAGRTARFASSSSEPYVDITDGMTITRSVSPTLPTAVTTLAIDASFSLTHPLQTQVSVVLDPPSGANITLVAAASLSGVGDYMEHDAIPIDRSGATFNFIAGDALVDAMIGTLQWISVTTTYTGGRAPFETLGTYTSTVREIDAARFGALSWSMRQAKADPIVSVRTCEAEADCEAETWLPVINGETPMADARKYFQYKVEIMTNGDVPASLDWIDLQYVGYVQP